MADLTVELVCRSEDLVVGTVVLGGRTSGVFKLDAQSVAHGLRNGDVSRMPEIQKIHDGVQMTCRRCHGNLYFRAADGELVSAMPGSAEVMA